MELCLFRSGGTQCSRHPLIGKGFMTRTNFRFFALLLFASMSAVAASPTVSGTVVSAKVINLDPEEKDWGVGDIEIITTKAEKIVVAKDHTCAKPKVSSHGDVGWSVWMDRDPSNIKTQHSGEILRVRQRDGAMADFHPNSRFIQDWNFVQADTAVAIASMSFHGPQYYIEYDLKTGRILDQVDGYRPYNELPAWAQPMSDDKP